MAWKAVAEWTPNGERYSAGQDVDAAMSSAKDPPDNNGDDVDDDGSDDGELVFEDGLDAEELEDLYQTALTMCPGDPEQSFQQLLKDRRQQ